MRILIDRELTKHEKRQLKKELTELMNLFNQLEAIGEANVDKNRKRFNGNNRIHKKKNRRA